MQYYTDFMTRTPPPVPVHLLQFVEICKRVVENYQPVVVGSTPSPAVVGPTHTVEAIPAPTEAPTIPPTPAYVSLGCWADIGSNRVLTGPADKAGLDMTTEVCLPVLL